MSPGYKCEYVYDYENGNVSLCESPTENISMKMSEHEHERMSLIRNPSEGASMIVIKSMNLSASSTSRN